MIIQRSYSQTKRCNGFSVASFVVIVFLSFLITFPLTVRSEDSLKNKYGTDDPRNPNCPCHRYQKQAEKEFKNKNKKISFKEEEKLNQSLKLETNDLINEVSKKKLTSKRKIFLRSKKRFPIFKSKTGRCRPRSRLFFKREIASCFVN